MEKEFLTISELNILIKDVLNYGFPNAVWICGEVQGFDRNRDKKHVFFELCEKDTESKDIVARIGLVIFGQRRNTIEEILKNSANAFDLKDDIEVKFLCRVDFYPPHGAVRLIVESIDPIYTLGKIAQERQKLIAILQKKGVLAKNKQLELPLVPLRIGLITSFDSAAYNDFVAELKKSGFAFQIFLINSLMQGKGTEASVCAALDRFDKMKGLDVAVITRGGGSIADLSCFDSRMIAEKIAASRFPVLSGIGHEINTTVTDLAAHTFAKTPTAVAQLLVEHLRTFIAGAEESLDRILELARNKSHDEKRKLKLSALGLHQTTTRFLQQHRQDLVRLGTDFKRQPLNSLRVRRAEIVNQRDIFLKSIKTYLQTGRQNLKNFAKLIDIVSPQNTIRRGFSITRTAGGRLVRGIKDVQVDAELASEVSDGFVQSKVVKIKEEQRGRHKVQ